MTAALIHAGAPDREIAISWSRLRSWTECRQKAFLQAQGKKSPAADIRVYFPGTVVDRAMRKWLEQDRQQPGELAAMTDQVLDAALDEARDTGDGVVRWRTLTDRAEVRDWCHELLTRLEPILFERVIPWDYSPALRFRTPLTVPYLDGSPQTVWLIGEMDLLCRTRQEPWHYAVWDLKGTADSNYWRKVTGQLLFYDLAVRCMFEIYPDASGLIQPMCEQPVLSFAFTPEHRAGCMQSIVRYCQSTWAGDVAPKDSTSGCDRCEVRHACARYAQPAGGRVAWPA